MPTLTREELELSKLRLEVAALKRARWQVWAQLVVGVAGIGIPAYLALRQGTDALRQVAQEEREAALETQRTIIEQQDLNRETQAAQAALEEELESGDAESIATVADEIVSRIEIPESLRLRADQLKQKATAALLAKPRATCQGPAFPRHAATLPSKDRAALARKCNASKTSFVPDGDKLRASPRGETWWWTLDDGSECACRRGG
jgi:hypothetical protein